MFHRIAAPLISCRPKAISTTDADSSEIRGTYVRQRVSNESLVFRNIYKRDCELTRSNSTVFGFCNSILPLLTYGFKRIFSEISVPQTWPPDVNGEMHDWITNISVPILPIGQESKVVLSRIMLPFSSVRVAVLGPRYMRAISIFSRREYYEKGGSESSWPITESSFLLTENSSAEYEIVTP